MLLQRGGYFKNTQLSTINIYGSGRIQLGGLLRHLSSKNPMTVIFHEGCTSTVHVNYSGRGYSLPSNSLTNWNIIVNPNLTYTAGYTKEDGSADLSLYNKAVTGLTLTMAATNPKAYEGTDLTTVHGLRDYAANESLISAVVKSYCEIYNEHGEFTAANPCMDQCLKCFALFASSNPTHLLDYVMEYANGYNVAGTKTTACTNEGCTHVDSVETLKALFETRGYSKDTESSAIVLDFTANKDEIEAYEAYLKTINAEASINFGVAVALGDNDDNVANDVLFDENGEQKAGTVVVKFNDKSYTNIQTKIMGINNNETALHLSGYVNVSGVITYINGEEIGEYSKKVNYGMFEE